MDVGQTPATRRFIRFGGAESAQILLTVLRLCVYSYIMSPKTRFQVMLELEQLEQMREIERDNGVPIARQIRMAVDRWLGEQSGKAQGKRAVTRRPR